MFNKLRTHMMDDTEQGAYEFKLLKKFKAHARILWSCDWTPNDVLFVTGSRDKTVSQRNIINVVTYCRIN